MTAAEAKALETAMSNLPPKKEFKVKDPVMTTQAWGYYNNPGALAGVRPRQVLPLVCLHKLVKKALKRPLTLEEIQLTVGLEKDEKGKVVQVKCHETGKNFSPFFFAWVTGRLMAYVRKHGKVDASAPFRWYGCMEQVNGEPVAYSGPLFKYTAVRDQPDIIELADSPLAHAFEEQIALTFLKEV